MVDDFEWKIDYIVRVVDESLDIVPSSIVAGDFDELTTCSTRLGATIGEAGVRLLTVGERGLLGLVIDVSKRCTPRWVS
jgi:hypothetical protein